MFNAIMLSITFALSFALMFLGLIVKNLRVTKNLGCSFCDP